jgi:hypothetical protein
VVTKAGLRELASLPGGQPMLAARGKNECTVTAISKNLM